MKKPVALLLLCALTFGSVALAGLFKSRSHNPYQLQNGDIVFQSTNSSQGKAIKAATNSPWTHVGMVFFRNGDPMVIEAVQPVRITPLKSFIARSPSTFYAMRLKNAEQHINAQTMARAEHYCNQQLGKNYDLQFRWSDDKIYCSELVWKVYKEAGGIELCQPRPFKAYNLKHPTVQRIAKQRYGAVNNLPLNELAVAPSDLAQSPLLIEVPKK
ncbi:YiiX family permuted papain-like enzyme [Verrucomicrobiaceae bacterium R5-34]|uniref:YiiX family permuted papain-like enzyme n=1 Tax=Oceaniferula flava TaxID=2800421 RepID=A0AAE2VBL1_9BACT|nr:YiiX family permuted papain-like enzyme [Oceaniferula flavus]MBK1829730.1 YiiX family permuted papain-like enzyme [Verrucomicrobiaceae bacterium R5-34]MBK1853916.1 YiiX family permuted papain-like enzyme [Oceaniferula flavus]MBM1135222.1 YiiX family permuted papain-like enzyme [Oceaniferula flavus]